MPSYGGWIDTSNNHRLSQKSPLIAPLSPIIAPPCLTDHPRNIKFPYIETPNGVSFFLLIKIRELPMKHKFAALKLAIIICLTLVTAQAHAAKSFTGVTIEEVTLYSNASSNGYVVGNLPAGSIVNVLDIRLNYFRTAAPTGVFSYIRKDDIKLNSSGDRAQVTAKRAQVRVAHQKGIKYSKRTHVTLYQGSIVSIVKNDPHRRTNGDYILIQAPQNAPIYIQPGKVRKATPAEIAAGRAAISQPVAPKKIIKPEIVKPKTVTPKKDTEAKTNKPASKTETLAKDTKTTTNKKTAKEAPKKDASAKDKKSAKDKLPKAVSLKMRALEDEFAAAQKLPILSRPHSKLIKDYAAATKDRKNKLGRVDTYIAKFRLRILKHELARANMIRRINKSLAKVQNTTGVQQLLLNVEQAQKTRYNFTGILMPSSVYNGKKLPRYYRLVDPASNRTLAYVQPNAAFVPKRHLGIWVGITGKKQDVRGINAKVIFPNTIEVLQAAPKK